MLPPSLDYVLVGEVPECLSAVHTDPIDYALGRPWLPPNAQLYTSKEYTRMRRLSTQLRTWCGGHAAVVGLLRFFWFPIVPFGVA